MTVSFRCRYALVLATSIALQLAPTLATAQVVVPAKTRPDFNGDGKDDLAIGVPGENTSAGGVSIIYGATGGLSAAGSQFWSQNSSGVPGAEQENDSCGVGLASGDFNGDGFVDLAMGCPGEDAPSAATSGAVIILYGSNTGLTGAGSQYWGQNSPGINGGSEPFDRCGTSLASGDINRDGFADLVWGCPGEDVGDLNEAGAVNVLFGSAAGLSASGNRFLSQDTTGAPETSESGETCGTTVAVADFNGDGFGDVAFGCPREDIGLLLDAGGVSVFFGISSGISPNGALFVSEDTNPQLDFDNAEAFDLCGMGLGAGDVNGDGRADLVFGCPGEDFFPTTFDVGSVRTLFGTSGGGFANGRLSIAGQDRGRCGAAIAVGRFTNDAFMDIAFGCTDANENRGHVHLLIGAANGGIQTGRGFSQDTFGVPDTAERGDNFGHAVATGDFDGNGFSDLAIGVPDEDFTTGNNVGAVNVIYFPLPPVLEPVRGELWNQDTAGIPNFNEFSDNFGFSLNGSGSTPIPGLTGQWSDDVAVSCRGASCSISGTFTVNNPSRLSTPHVVLRFYLSDDQTLDGDDLLLSTMPVRALDVGESQVRTLRTTLPEGVEGPGKYVIAFVDADDEVAEANEANNIVASPPIP